MSEYGCNENAIEFIKDEKRATVTFTQGRYKGRIRKLAKSHPEECQIVAENQDGSMCAHIPVEWIRINPGIEISKEHRDKLRENIKKAHHALYENGQISTQEG